MLVSLLPKITLENLLHQSWIFLEIMPIYVWHGMMNFIQNLWFWIFRSKFWKSATSTHENGDCFSRYVYWRCKKYIFQSGSWLLKKNMAPQKANFFDILPLFDPIIGSQQHIPKIMFYFKSLVPETLFKNAIKTAGKCCWFYKMDWESLFSLNMSPKKSAIMKISNNFQKSHYYFYNTKRTNFPNQKRN